MTLAQLHRLAAEGLTRAQIAKALGVTGSAVLQMARRHGIVIRNPTADDGAQTLATVRAELARGTSAVEAARAAGVTRQRVYQLIHQFKLEVQR